ncbi:hypothetical protein AAHE18_18G152100 [Arachis hypogaea]
MVRCWSHITAVPHCHRRVSPPSLNFHRHRDCSTRHQGEALPSNPSHHYRLCTQRRGWCHCCHCCRRFGVAIDTVVSTSSAHSFDCWSCCGMEPLVGSCCCRNHREGLLGITAALFSL